MKELHTGPIHTQLELATHATSTKIAVMSRYRPPRAPSSPYITADGLARLQGELKFLWKTKRPEVTRKVSEAAKMGDRSENAEYIYGKRQLREIDGRIRFLSKRLDELKVVDKLPLQRENFFLAHGSRSKTPVDRCGPTGLSALTSSTLLSNTLASMHRWPGL
jgi:hypothetical protein